MARTSLPWRLTVLAALTTAGMCVAQTGMAQTEKPPAGIAVGTKAPEFKLTGADGEEHTLKDLIGEGDKVLALVFYRSADW